ncbi:MAG TPA: AI-2E family transporter [Herpetosiphonaceae bacterium]
MDGLSAFLATWTTRKVMFGTCVVLSVFFLAYLTVEFYSVLLIAFVAFVVSTAIRPLISRLQRLKIPPELGVIIAYLLVLGALAGLAALLAPLVANQLAAINTKVPEYYNDIRRMLNESPSALVRNLSLRLPTEAPLDLPLLSTPATSAPDPALAVDRMFQVLGAAGKTVFVFIATLLLGFYWTLDGERVRRAMVTLAPAERRDGVRDTLLEIEHKMGAYVRGQLILDLSIGLMATAAYLLIGIEYAVVFGLLAGIMETVPIIGPILGAVPPALVTLANGNTSALIWIVVATVIIQQIEGAFLVPKVMDRAVGVNAVVTLLAFAAFTPVFGLVGGILAVPLAAIVQIIFERLVFSPVEVAQQIDRRDRLGVVRYQAQDLAQSLRLRVRDKDNAQGEEVQQVEERLEAIVSDLDALLNQSAKAQEAAA